MESEAPSHMTNADFARELLARLNGLLADPDVEPFIRELVAHRIPVTQAVTDHPTIMVDGSGEQHRAGLLGLLNGLCGVVTEGKREGWGYIGAEFKKPGGALARFVPRGGIDHA